MKNIIINNLNQYINISEAAALNSEADAVAQTFIPTYDLNGNQTLIKTINNESKTPATWNVEYNGENRPIKWTNNATNESIVMYYDYRGRRCGKLFYNSDGIWQSSVKFFYNNFTLIQESTASNIITKEFVWDPSEPVATRPLAMKCNVQNLNLLYTHDANKNVTEVFFKNPENGLAAHYEYSPFGELRDFSHLSSTPETSNSEVNSITETSNPGPQSIENEVLSHALNSGTNASAETLNSANASPGNLIGWRDTPITKIDIRSFNPFRFSSEYHDDELNLIYYNYRHYNPATGRWLSREPLEEYGSVNLYAMCFNDVINYIDVKGELPFPLIIPAIIKVIAGISTTKVVVTTVAVTTVGIGAVIVENVIHKRTNEDAKAKEKTKAITKTKLGKAYCLPCVPSVGTIEHRIDTVPSSRPHYPCEGTHTHLYIVIQSPVDKGCICRWNKSGVLDGPQSIGNVHTNGSLPLGGGVVWR